MDVLLFDRQDVYRETFIAPLKTEVKYRCRYVSEDQKTGMFSFVLTPACIPQTTELAIKLYTDYYLTKNIDDLKLDMTGIARSQMVVSVDKASNQVYRCIVKGVRTSDSTCLVYCVDHAILHCFPLSSIYATTKLVVATEPSGVQCRFNGVDLFFGTQVLKDAIKATNKFFHPGLDRNVEFDLIVKRFTGDGIPVVDLWAINDDGPCEQALNKVWSFQCLAEWKICFEEKTEVGSKFPGMITHVDGKGKLSVHLPIDGDDSPAVYMDAYLQKVNVRYLQDRFPRFTLADLNNQVEKMKSTMYIGQCLSDELFYRVKIVTPHNSGVWVQFIDYGNNGFIPYDYLFEAKDFDPLLDKVPPLVWESHMCGVQEPIDKTGKALVEYFAKVADLGFDLQFEVKDGYCVNLPLTSIYAYNGPQNYSVVQEVIDRGLASLRRRRNSSGALNRSR